MGKFKSKLAKRIMAFVLSGAMVLSNMSVYAAELATETVTETAVEEEKTAEETVAAESSEAKSEPVSSETDKETSDSNDSTTSETVAETETAEETKTSTDVSTEEPAETETATEEETTKTETTETMATESTEQEETTTEAEDNENEDVRATNTYDAGIKTDVWDFGVEDLTDVNNMFTVDIVNSFYPESTKLGADGNTTITSFAIDKNGNLVNVVDAESGQLDLSGDNASNVDFCFNDGGFHTTHRWRLDSNNPKKDELKYHSNQSRTIAGIAYQGCLYSNKGGDKNVYIGVKLDAGDIMTAAISGNNLTDAFTLTVEDPDGNRTDFARSSCDLITFYATKAGMYKMYMDDGSSKLVVTRVTRVHTNTVTVSGSVALPGDAPSDLALTFKCNESGEEKTAAISNGSYSISLNDQHSYVISTNNSAFVLSEEDSKLELAKDAGNTTKNIEVLSVERYKLSGEIKGLDAAAVEALEDIVFEKPADKVYIPQITISKPETEGGAVTYEVMLEKGVEYAVRTEGINDYQLTSADKVTINENTTQDITYELKPVYKVTISPIGATLAELEEAGATVIFTNLYEEGYVYTYSIKAKPTGDDVIYLRDGTYNVEVKNSGTYAQKRTSNLAVRGKNVVKAISFEVASSVWDFGSEEFLQAASEDIKAGFKGLKFSNIGRDSKGYATMANGKDEAGNVVPDTSTIMIPVNTQEEFKVVVTYLYNANVRFENEETTKIATADGSTSKTHTAEYVYKVGDPLINDGYVTLTHVDGDVAKDDGTTKTITKSYLTKIQVMPNLAYRDTITVGAKDCDYKTINEALDEVRTMDRAGENGAVKPVTISIQPGNYEEMLVIDVDNVKFVNAAGANASTELTDAGVNIADNAVRITSYYGHGYTYYSMGSDCKWDKDVLKSNLQNGYPSFTNPGSGTTAGSYWNATVVITGSNVSAQGIIFENSFNQYISKKASEDELVPQAGAKEGSVPRNDLPEGSTAVQDKAYVERAAALAIANNCKEIYFDNCKFIGRQDTLYGGTDVTAGFYGCSIYGGTDYIFGGMTAVFAKCNLVFNTSEDKNDVGYITAAQQKAGRGYLMYNCHVTSTVPGVDTASEYPSKPGYLGRPWEANTGEAVFYKTLIDAVDTSWYETHGASLIQAVGWTNTLGGASVLSQEYGTFEYAKDVDNSDKRAEWATVLTEEKLADGSPITVDTFLGSWNPFEGKDMEIVMPTEEDKVDNAPKNENVKEVKYVLDIGEIDEYKAMTSQTNLEIGGKKESVGTDGLFSIYYKVEGASRIETNKRDFTDGYSTERGINFQAGASATGPAAAIQFSTDSAAKVKVYWRSGGSSSRGLQILKSDGTQVAKTAETTDTNSSFIDTLELAEGGDYLLGGTNGVRIYRVEVITTVQVRVEEVNYTLDIGEVDEYKAMTSQTNLEIGGKKESVGTDGFFSIYYKAEGASRIETNKRDFSDGYSTERGINFQAGASATGPAAAIQFSTDSAAKVKVYWRSGGSSSRGLQILKSDGTQVAKTAETTDTNSSFIDTLELTEGGDYLLGGTNGVRIYKVEVTTTVEKEIQEVNCILDIGEVDEYKAMTSQTNLEIGGKKESVGTDGFFSIYYKAEGASRIETNKRDFSDGYSTERGLNFQAGASATGPAAAIQFSTQAEATVKVYWRSGGSSARGMQILKSDGTQVAKTEDTTDTSSSFIDTFELTEGGDYLLGGTNGVRVYRVEVKTTIDKNQEEVVRPDWSTVDSPTVTAALAVDENGKNSLIEVTVNALVGTNGGDKVTVVMQNAEDTEGVILADDSSTATSSTHKFSFAPESSGTYKFIATLSRKDETDTKNGESEAFAFMLPLGATHINSITNLGNGSVEVDWVAVKEATGYKITVNEKAAEGQTGKEVFTTQTTDPEALSFVISDLVVGTTYVFSVAPVRGEEVGAADTAEKKITADKQQKWTYGAYGASVGITSGSCGYTDADHTGKLKVTNYPNENNKDEKDQTIDDPEDVRVWSMNGSGKIVPNSTDGISFYYTEVNPNENNFKLSAIAHVNQWAYSNGQDGFGLLVSDRVGVNGDGSDFWTNSYMAVATKVEYYWDKENGTVADEGDRANMRLGIGTIERYGVTADNLSQFENPLTVGSATTNYFNTSTTPLDTTVHKGTYNLIANNIGGLGDIATIANPYEDIWFQIELNNTGYYISYAPATKDADGNYTYDEEAVATNRYYNRDRLSQIDKDLVYVGFFASRNADITYKDISFTTSAYDPTAEPEEADITYVTPSYSVTSASTANSPDYELAFSANWEGHVVIRDEMGNELVSGDAGKIKDQINETTGAYTKTYNTVEVPVKLGIGTNTFKITFTPSGLNHEDKDNYYNPDSNLEKYLAGRSDKIGFTQLLDYTPQTFTFTVTYKEYGAEGEALYVSPLGSASGIGTKANPLDIYTAVKYVAPGQTIYLMEGTYNLSQTVRIERGIDGTKDKRIYLLVDPDAKSRPVFDFGGKCEGVILAGDYWYLKGFDVTRSENGKDGIRVCGEYNVLEQMNTYKNGNTGIQISRYLGSDLWDNWPRYNLILNCTSYLNADSGYEDADGFAAKLTVAEGNVFDGCIAAYNADDGWDLFAKVETGEIGSVMIKNSIAYKNGYVLVKDGELSLDGEEVSAGNGNGFKLGGTSLFSHPDYAPYHHTVQNCAAFYNKAKGIDSNSCPNIQAINSVSFNNESYNVAYYTNVAADTDYVSNGLISFRTDFLTVGDQMTLASKKPDNAQKMDQIYNGSSYYWDPAANRSYTRDEKGASITTGSFVKKTWFESIDFDEFQANSKITENGKTTLGGLRYADGTLNMHGFLTLTGIAPIEGGAVGDAVTQPEEDELIKEEIPPADETNGEINKGDAADEGIGGVLPEDVPMMPTVESGTTLGLWIGTIDTSLCGYTGKAVKPTIHLYDGTTLLKEGKNYTISYRNNVNAYVNAEKETNPAYAEAYAKGKVPTIIIKGKGNYAGAAIAENNPSNTTINGAIAVNFDITPVDIGGDALNRVAAKDIALVEKSSAQRITPVLTFNGKKLSSSKNKDYSYEIFDEAGKALEDNKVTAAGKYTIEFTGHKNYTGTRTANVYVISADNKNMLASSFKVNKIARQTRRGYTGYNNTGDPIPVTLTTIGSSPDLIVSDKNGTPLVEGTDYELSYVNNIEVGVATVIITGIAPKYYGTKEAKFSIIAPDFNSLISDGMLQVYTGGNPANGVSGKELCDAVPYLGKAVEISGLGLAQKVDGEWKALVRGEDFTLTYSNNNRAGAANVIFKGKNNFKGTIRRTFKITPYDLSIEDADHYNAISGTFARNANGAYKDSLVVKAVKGANKPSVVLTINGNKMIQGKDYTISYRNNTWSTRHNGPEIVIKGKGALRGTLVKPFTITAKDLSDSENPITMTIDDVGISGRSGDGFIGKGTPKVVLKDSNGKTLSSGSDYDKATIKYEKISGSAGSSISADGKTATISSEDDIMTVKVTVKAKGGDKCQYTGEISGEYRVAYSKNLLKNAKVQVNYATDKYFEGGKTHFKYTGQDIRLYQPIDGAKLNNYNIPDEEKYYYTLTVTINGETLRYGRDFEILKYADGSDSYKRNNVKGGATVTIKAAANSKFAGTKVVKFYIGPKDISDGVWWEQVN